MRNTITLIALMVVCSFSIAAYPQSSRERLDKIEQSLKADVPKILCLDEKFATSGQPGDSAYEKLAANGFKSVLNLRTAAEGVDLEKEKSMVEAAGMRYVSIPVVPGAPKSEQVDQFIQAVKSPANQPVLIHCASANRAGAFWMIYRVVEQNWPEEKALEEATRAGLANPALKTFAHEQIAARKK